MPTAPRQPLLNLLLNLNKVRSGGQFLASLAPSSPPLFFFTPARGTTPHRTSKPQTLRLALILPSCYLLLFLLPQIWRKRESDKLAAIKELHANEVSSSHLAQSFTLHRAWIGRVWCKWKSGGEKGGLRSEREKRKEKWKSGVG
jgi:hypothetical protein